MKLKDRVIERFRGKYSVEAMCEVFEVSRSGYYAWRKRQERGAKDQWLADLIVDCQKKCRQTYGIRRVRRWIQRQTGKGVNLKAILLLMRKLNLLSVVRRRRSYTRCQQAVHKYPNLLNRRFAQPRPNQFWVTDITYIPIPGSMLYMCAVLDLCRKVVLNWKIGSEMSSSLVTDTIHHAAQAPTCTKKGWNAYDACGREGCGYTTYQELDALGHSYEARTVQPTCTKKGYTLHTCVRCKDRYTDAVVSSRGHWYGEWSPNGDTTSSADCRRNGCKHTGKVPCEPLACRLLLRDAEAYDFTLCPVCGETGNGARLTLIEEARATAQRLPRGKLTLRIGDLQNGERVLSVGFEYGGKLTQPTGQMEITLPAALLDGYALMLLDADGAETALSHTLNGGEATFALDFAADESPALVLRLIPVS